MTLNTTRFALIGAMSLMAGCALPAFLDGTGAGTATGTAVSETPSAPPTVQLSAKERLVSALEANGCVLNTDNVGAVTLQASIGRDDIAPLIRELEAEGLTEVTDSDGIRILSPNCI